MIGVLLAESVKIGRGDHRDCCKATKQNVLIQKFVAESKRQVTFARSSIGDRVVAAMRRVAQGDGIPQQRAPRRQVRNSMDPRSKKFEETADSRGADHGSCSIAGVDMLEGRSGPQIMEINSSPGLEGIEGATKLDIAGSIIDYAQEHVRFPELDIRQRLTVSRGYGVSELQIPEGSEFVGKTIAESGLREKDIAVLALHRGTTVIPNPREARELEGGDRLLCFGKRELMKDLIPERRQRIRKRKTRQLETDVPAQMTADREGDA